MNRLERNKKINELNHLFESMKVKKNIQESLKPMIDDILTEVTKDNEYIYVTKEIFHKYRNGRIEYYGNSKEVRFKKSYLSSRNHYDDLICKITWHCEKLHTADDVSEFKVTIRVYIDDKHETLTFKEVFDMEKVLLEQKRFFKMRPYINYLQIVQIMSEEYLKLIKEEMKEAIDVAMKKKM